MRFERIYIKKFIIINTERLLNRYYYGNRSVNVWQTKARVKRAFENNKQRKVGYKQLNLFDI